MVRPKFRWLVLKIEFTDQQYRQQKDNPKTKTSIELKNIHSAIHDHSISNFGPNGLLHDLRTLFYDSSTQLCIIRISRCYVSSVKAIIPLIASIKKQNVLISILSTHGSERTLKLNILRLLKRLQELKEMDRNKNNAKKKSQTVNQQFEYKQEFKSCLDEVLAIDTYT